MVATGLGVALAGSAHTRLTAAMTGASPGAYATAEQTPPGGIFTAAQAAAGQGTYQARCASCHLADLGGRNEASPLAGSSFMNVWRTRSTKELYDYIRTSMPPGGAPLGPDEYVNVTAFILQANGAVVGATALAPDTAVAIGTIATGVRPTALAAAAARASRAGTAGRTAAAARPLRAGRGAALHRRDRSDAAHAAGRRLADGAA